MKRRRQMIRYRTPAQRGGLRPSAKNWDAPVKRCTRGRKLEGLEFLAGRHHPPPFSPRRRGNRSQPGVQTTISVVRRFSVYGGKDWPSPRREMKFDPCVSGWLTTGVFVFIKRGAFDGNNGRRGSAGPTGLMILIVRRDGQRRAFGDRSARCIFGKQPDRHGLIVAASCRRPGQLCRSVQAGQKRMRQRQKIRGKAGFRRFFKTGMRVASPLA